MPLTRRPNPRAQRPSLRERLAQEQAELEAQVTISQPALQETSQASLAEVIQEPEARQEIPVVEQPEPLVAEEKPVAVLSPPEETVLPEQPVPQVQEPLSIQAPLEPPVQAPEEREVVTVPEPVRRQPVQSGQTRKKAEPVPAPGAPYIVHRRPLSTKIDARLVKAMQFISIEDDRYDYEVWEEAAKNYLRLKGKTW